MPEFREEKLKNLLGREKDGSREKREKKLADIIRQKDRKGDRGEERGSY